MIILNLKTYSESSGRNARKLLNIIQEYINENPGIKDLIYIAPSVIEMVLMKNLYPEINVISQTVDNVNQGQTTGFIPSKSLLTNKITMSMFNHSECKKNPESLIDDIETIQEAGVKLIVGCETFDEGKKLVEAKPFALAFEPSELIGSGISVTKKSELIAKFVDLSNNKEIKIIIGAGISTREDVVNGIKLGANGIILSTAFIRAKDPKAKLSEIIEPYL